MINGEIIVKKLLYIDCSIRKKASRTARLASAFLGCVDREKYDVETLDLTELKLEPLNCELLARRDALIEKQDFGSELFSYARQFAEADAIVIAAPFWDLGFPAQLKIYFENVSVGGITFTYNQFGMVGKCRARELVFLTTRGGIYLESALECGSSYIDALTKLFGIEKYSCIAAEGLDIDGFDVEAIMKDAEAKAEEAARAL